jgi:uncharacterized membrane-anchored protein
MRKWIALAAGVLVLAVANMVVYEKERLLADGRVVLLELAPVDPRSLMQGDYMALRYTAANAAFANGAPAGLPDGCIVLSLDERGIGSFARLDDSRALGPDEARMRYRIRDGQVKFGTNAFFFQEGDAHLYDGARYGEFRVAPTGNVILTGLRGKDLRPLGRPASN